MNVLGLAFRDSLVAQMVKSLPEIQEMWYVSVGQEDPLEEGMATQIPWTVGSGRLQSIGSQRVRHN